MGKGPSEAVGQLSFLFLDRRLLFFCSNLRIINLSTVNR